MSTKYSRGECESRGCSHPFSQTWVHSTILGTKRYCSAECLRKAVGEDEYKDLFEARKQRKNKRKADAVDASSSSVPVPGSAYQLYRNAKVKELGLSNDRDALAIATTCWKNMSNEEKRPYDEGFEKVVAEKKRARVAGQGAAQGAQAAMDIGPIVRKYQERIRAGSIGLLDARAMVLAEIQNDILNVEFPSGFK